jgi:uncharacterized membrane protein YwzB
MVFASVSTTVFDTFNCETFGDDPTHYMSSDQSIDCDDPTHKKYQGFAYVMIMVYPVGIPLLYFTVLYWNRKALQAEDRLANTSLLKISFLWDTYEPEMWWFEVFECFRRLSMTGLLIFVFRGKASQIVVALIISAFSVVAFVHFKPYLKDENDSLAIVSQVAIFFTLFAALLKRVNVDQTDKYDQNTFGYLLIAINVIGVGMAVSGFFVKPLRRLLRALASKHIHTSDFRGRPNKNADAEQLASHFRRVATSTPEEAGWKAMTERDYKTAVKGAQDWLDETEAVGEWRCCTGDGPMDEFRVIFTIDLNIDDVYKYVTHDQVNRGWESTTIERSTVKEEGCKKTQYFAVKFPFPLSARDYLWERFLVEKGNEKIVCCRSIIDDRLAPMKKSHSECRVRAHLYVGGYLLSCAGDNGEKTKIVYSANSDLKGVFALELVARRVAPTQVVSKVNELRKVAEVMAGPSPLPGEKHPLSYMWTTNEGATLENPSERRQGTAAASATTTSGRLFAKNTSTTANRDRGPSAFDMFSGGFAKGRTQRAQTGGSTEGFEVSENPMGQAMKRGMMGGSSKKSVGFAETPPRAANQSDVEMATFASGSERPARKLTDIIGVPLPPADWEGYKDPKYKVQKKMKEDEDAIFRSFQEQDEA